MVAAKQRLLKRNTVIPFGSNSTPATIEKIIHNQQHKFSPLYGDLITVRLKFTEKIERPISPRTSLNTAQAELISQRPEHELYSS